MIEKPSCFHLKKECNALLQLFPKSHTFLLKTDTKNMHKFLRSRHEGFPSNKFQVWNSTWSYAQNKLPSPFRRTSNQDYIHSSPCSLVICNSYLSLGEHQIDASVPEFVVNFEASPFSLSAAQIKIYLGLVQPDTSFYCYVYY